MVLSCFGDPKTSSSPLLLISCDVRRTTHQLNNNNNNGTRQIFNINSLNALCMYVRTTTTLHLVTLLVLKYANVFGLTSWLFFKDPGLHALHSCFRVWLLEIRVRCCVQGRSKVQWKTTTCGQWVGGKREEGSCVCFPVEAWNLETCSHEWCFSVISPTTAVVSCLSFLFSLFSRKGETCMELDLAWDGMRLAIVKCQNLALYHPSLPNETRLSRTYL